MPPKREKRQNSMKAMKKASKPDPQETESESESVKSGNGKILQEIAETEPCVAVAGLCLHIPKDAMCRRFLSHIGVK